MALQLTRTATSGVVGVGSGAIGQLTNPRTIGGQTVGFDTMFEVASLVVGAGMQFMMPFSMPNVADGLVDGGIALGARRLTGYALRKSGMTPAASYGAYAMGGRAHVGAMNGAAYARPALGTISASNKVKLT